MLEESSLLVDGGDSGVAAERAIGPDDAVTGNDERHGVSTQRVTDGPRSPRPAEAARELRVAGGLAEGYAPCRLEDAALEVAQGREVEVYAEDVTVAFEEAADLALDSC